MLVNLVAYIPVDLVGRFVDCLPWIGVYRSEYL